MTTTQTKIKNNNITIRQTQIDDATKLPAIELSAGQLFSTLEDLRWISESGVQSVEKHVAFIRQQGHWVAVNRDNEPVGFIMTTSLPESLFIHELSVSLDWQNRGIGKLLIQKVKDEAKLHKFDAITLTTFRHVPWNAPYYQRLGFSILPESEIPSSLQAVLDNEVERGGFAKETRCAMKFEIKEQK
ncbi:MULTISPECIES: GNAT family N-acetyltransferase [Enterobacterales]|uniref:GNAT family N-acetyltransferase n=1 Tax=Enterobacterales TaxID=91347 RepID=UPI00084824A8|nr:MULTISPECIES: GNAT family N-acetyltransferase [Enterobacterales]WOO48579.1 GNAT family N-acetyltransferase [Hafnia alvei]MCK9782995.1 GNAT family N-acetyltransferase [Proteus columbae]MCT6516993.1 GNAT family N-acetyltransferase [Proteus vulgaris]ODQ07228.1 GNAT family N-acetyltransferase [Shigella sp. FC130]OEI94625.1 GNAT family N-acetyltransferase [Shigella sp. FC1655]